MKNKSRIFAEDKEEYIKALVTTREDENPDIFRRFMTDVTEAHIARDIATYLESTGESDI